MFIGHYAVGFASKRFAPRTSLGVLMAAALFLDLLWPIFVLMGWEQVRIEPGNTAFTPLNFVSYPISHSLLAAVGWATLFALLYLLATRYRRGAVVIWFGVVSHWVTRFRYTQAGPAALPRWPTTRTVVVELPGCDSDC